jgi:spore coat polysaccharide biosynthesis protein SpsF
MNTVAIVQARMGSTRLPGKILKKINNKVILDYVIDRLRFCKKLDNIVLATTTAKNDDILEQYSVDKKIDYFRGSEEDVLSRYYHAANIYKADIIVRITSDCPFIDPEIVDMVIKKHIGGNFDYTANTIKRTYPRGLDVEVFNFDVLESDFKNANEKHQREHVTPYIKEHPEKFKLKNIEAKDKLKRPDIRITIDTIEDYELIKKIIQNFNNLNFKAKEIIDFLDKNPDLLEINKNIKQKSVRPI